jgi:hypothetical protein
MPMPKKMFETKYELTLTTILTLAFGFEFLDRLAMAFMLPIIQPQLGITNEQIGILGLKESNPSVLKKQGRAAIIPSAASSRLKSSEV